MKNKLNYLLGIVIILALSVGVTGCKKESILEDTKKEKIGVRIDSESEDGAVESSIIVYQ